ncbi:hypothetical protein SCHPADRAFT_411069 [Schizopora paradoxa]|uniref:F-box domain-containing protein n=1 Tax=Schizopora paradoxa TaxID=27342 RepID=A0A0H2RSX2_9AGAM|nr:hypothetical protein SCHPADRAFT_411069 [Schizopora paradoxa]
MKATLNGLLDSITDLQDGFELFVAPISSKLSRGIASLPDELIGLVFKYACVEIGTKQAVWLSHVSRGFRRIAISEVDLWTTLHSRARPDEIETYLSRSRQADLYVVVNITPDDYNEDLLPFFTSCFASASRLKSFSITAELDDGEYPSNLVLSNELTDLDSGELEFPRLEELCISHYKKSRDGMHSDNFAFEDFSPSWDAPVLRTIRCRDYIPTPTATAFTSITSFSLQISLRSGNNVQNFGWLLEFLESASNLSNFDLEVFDADRFECEFLWCLTRQGVPPSPIFRFASRP